MKGRILISGLLFLVLAWRMDPAAVRAAPEEENPPTDIVFVLDNSGSMKKNDPECLAREVITSFLIGVGPADRLGMVVFDRSPSLVQPLVGMTDHDGRVRFLESLGKIRYDGRWSDSPAAVERAIYELRMRGRKGAAKALVFLSDGIVDTGDRARDRERVRWLREDLTGDCRRAGIRIMGITFNDRADFSVIETLALKTDGEYFRVHDFSGVEAVFGRIMRALRVPPAGLETALPGKTVPPAETVSQAPPPSEPPPAAPARIGRGTLLFQGFLATVVILMAVIVILMHLKRKEAPGADKAGKPEPRRRPDGMPQALLVDVKNVTSRKTLILDKKTITIGRGSNNDVAIPGDTVSGFHAIIEYREDAFYLEDQRSTNKTYLNGEEIGPYSPRRLKSGDEIIFADYRFIFLIAYQTPAGETIRVG